MSRGQSSLTAVSSRISGVSPLTLAGQMTGWKAGAGRDRRTNGRTRSGVHARVPTGKHYVAAAAAKSSVELDDVIVLRRLRAKRRLRRRCGASPFLESQGFFGRNSVAGTSASRPHHVHRDQLTGPDPAENLVSVDTPFLGQLRWREELGGFVVRLRCLLPRFLVPGRTRLGSVLSSSHEAAEKSRGWRLDSPT